ncbi:MAG: cytochrome C [Sulfuritalea sp.]|nr:cytochrome C [Sulfuritalea sp.]
MNAIRPRILAAFTLLAAAPVLAVDESAATDLIKDSRCTKCHAVTMEKIGPPYRDTAAKYKGKPDAIAALTRHITVPGEVEIDGEKKAHGLVESTDPGQIKNLVEWILSR